MTRNHFFWFVAAVCIAGSALADSTVAGKPTVKICDPTTTKCAQVTDGAGGPGLAVEIVRGAGAAGGGGIAQLQVRSGANAWADVGFAGGDLNLPVVLQAAIPAGTNVIGHIIVDTAPTTAITAAALPLPTGAAQDATLTGGTAKAIMRGAAKGATTAGDATTTPEGADHQAVDVQSYHGGAAIDPRSIRALTSSDTVTCNAGSGTFTTGSLTDAQLRASAVPISAAALPLPALAAQDRPTAAAPNAAQLSDGAAFYVGAKTGQLPVALLPSGAFFVQAMAPPPLNPLLPRCNAVRRTACQP